MLRDLPEPLRSATEAAVVEGLGFLQAGVGADGAWLCEHHQLARPAEIMPSVFVAASGVLALEVCDDPRVERIVSSSRDFVVSRIESPGVWRFAPPYALDLDDTAVCSLAIGPHSHPWMFLGRNIRRILSFRDDDGRFLTWMSSLGPFGRPNDADPVVNANVVAYLGDRVETRAAQQWIERLVGENREDKSSIWYGSPMDLYYCVSRASRVAAPAFEGLRATLAKRIPGTRIDDTLRAAQALSSLDMLEEVAQAGFARQCAERLIDMQHRNGGWEACEFSRGPRGVGAAFRSEVLTTAYCIEALTRLIRAGNGASLPPEDRTG